MCGLRVRTQSLSFMSPSCFAFEEPSCSYDKFCRAQPWAKNWNSDVDTLIWCTKLILPKRSSTTVLTDWLLLKSQLGSEHLLSFLAPTYRECSRHFYVIKRKHDSRQVMKLVEQPLVSSNISVWITVDLPELVGSSLEPSLIIIFPGLLLLFYHWGIHLSKADCEDTLEL